MSRSSTRARSDSQNQFFGPPNAAHSLPGRPDFFYVDLHEVPNIFEEYQNLPEAHRLTQNYLPDLTAAVESKFFRFEGLDITIRLLMHMVAEQISSPWNTRMIQQELRATIRSPAGTLFTLDNRVTIRELLDGHRPWWRTKQDFGILPRVPFWDPTSPCIFRLTCQRASPAGYTS